MEMHVPRLPESILAELRSLRGLDTEFAHSEADKLLIEFIRWCCYIGEVDASGHAEEIIAAYEAVPKWYA